jgi:ppGpp synthetase/RelA/SpoT-type nucleotidyltranferase
LVLRPRGKNKGRRRMTFEEYRLEGHLRYAAFVAAIRHILEAAVDAQKIVPHAISGRAKQPKSLRKKLVDNGIALESAIDKTIKDLAGARIVFLTNGQVAAFNNTGILHDNFEVVSVNVHHPVPGTETETKLFDSTNYLVRLKPERLALPEYQGFEGLRAEIQVQTLLNHAWAEMGHDTIYKQPNLQHVGQKRLDAIKVRMDKVMRDHLLPAGHDFDKIARDFRQLVQADESTEETVGILAGSTDNNALDDAIGNLDDLILPHFDDRTAQFVKLVPMLIDAVERTRGSNATLVETVFGSYPGKGGDDIARKVAQLFGDHLYCDPVLTN